MAKKSKFDRKDWTDNQAVDKLLKATAGENGEQQQLIESVSQNVMPIVKSFLEANADVSELDEILANDPEAMAEFENMMKGKQVNKRMRDEITNLASMITTMQIDPDMLRDSVDRYDFPHERIKPQLLRRAGNSAAARMIKQYRYHQLEEFAQVSDGKRPGFKLVFIDAERKATKKEQDTIAEWENIFARQFFFVPNENKPNMGKFLRYAFQDFFDLDKIAIETVRTQASTNKTKNYRGTPLGLALQDSGTIFHVLPRMEQANTGVDLYRWDRAGFSQKLEEAGVAFEYEDEIRYLQVDRHGQRRAGYTDENMILSHAFGTTDLTEQFQGYSIVEQSLEILRYIIDSIIYNYTRRSTGTMPKGMITIEGATEDGFSRQEMELFRKLIWGIASGRKDKWKYPVLGTPKGVKPTFTRFHESSKEMEDFLWVSTLFSILCSFAGMDPENISLASQKNTLGKQRLFDKKAEEGAEFRSQDEGLRFFLNYMSGILNRAEFVEELTGLEGIEWRWLGLDVEDEVKKRELDKTALETTSSINDLLVAQDKDEYELMMGDVNLYDIPAIGNPTILQLILQALQAKAGEGDMMGGAEGFDEDEQPDYLGGENFAEPKEQGSPSAPAKPPEKSEPKPAKPPAGKPIRKAATVSVEIH